MNLSSIKKIFYMCPDSNKPIGGVKSIYHHVDILNSHNIEAYVLHSNPKFRCTWFENKTKVAYVQIGFMNKVKALKDFLKKKIKNSLLSHYSIESNMLIDPKASFITVDENGNEVSLGKPTIHDILVYPEFYAYILSQNYSDQFFVIFNQGVYNTFKNSRFVENNPYHNSKLLGALVVSENSLDYLNLAFPQINVYRVHNSINPKMFSFHKHKKKQIAYVKKDLWESDIRQVTKILQSRGQLQDWKFAPIENLKEEEVSQILKESLIYLSFPYQEGFSLPPAEALACGCIVIGYHGQGGKEYLKEPWAFPILSGDIVDFVKKIEEVALSLNKDRHIFEDQSENTSKYILNEYSNENEVEDLMLAWRNFDKKHEMQLVEESKFLSYKN